MTWIELESIMLSEVKDKFCTYMCIHTLYVCIHSHLHMESKEKNKHKRTEKEIRFVVNRGKGGVRGNWMKVVKGANFQS